MTPTSDKDAVLEKLSRTGRSLARLGAVTRAICIVMLFLAFCLLMYAFSRADRHTDDFVGFGIISIAVAALALVFWSTAVFHRAFGESLVLLFSMNDHLEALRSQARSSPGADPVRGRSSSRAASGAAPPAAQALLAFTAPTGGAAPPWTTEAAPEPTSPVEPPVHQARAAGSGPDALGARIGAQDGPAAAAHEAAAAALAVPPPATKTCRHCGGRIKVDALRCRHCFEPV